MGTAGSATLPCSRPPGARLAAATAALAIFSLAAGVLLWPALAGDSVVSSAGVFVQHGPFPEHVRDRIRDPIALGSDAMQQFSPWLRYAADGWLREGRIPLWKTTALCGAPFVGNGQSAVYFPTHLLAIALAAPVWIHTLEAFVKLVGGAFGAYLLARHLRLSFLASLLCGLVFGFGGYQFLFLQHPHTNVSALLPLLLLLADAVALRPTPWRVTGLALVAGLQHLGGHPETAFHCQVAALVLAAARCLSLRRERAAGAPWVRLTCVVAGLVLGAGLGAIQTLPLLEYIGESDMLRRRALGHSHLAEQARLQSVLFLLALLAACWSLQRLARSPRRIAWPALALAASLAIALLVGLPSGLFQVWMQLLAPDWYGEIRSYSGPGNYVEQNTGFAGAAWPLALLALLAGRPRGLVRAAGVTLALGLLIGFNAPIVSEAVQALPVFRLAANKRLLLLALMAGAVLAGIGLDALGQLARDPPHRRRLLLALLLPALVGWGVLAARTLSGDIASPNVPQKPSYALDLSAGLLPADDEQELISRLSRRAPHERFLTPPEDAKLFSGVIAARSAPAAVRLVYGRNNVSVPAQWVVPLTILGYPERPLPAAPDLDLYAFRAAVPWRDVPPELPGVRVWAAFTDRSQAMSELLVHPQDEGVRWLPFPAQPATKRTWWQLLWVGLVLMVTVALLHARGSALVAARVTLLLLVAGGLHSVVSGAIPLQPADLVYPGSPPLSALKQLAPQARMVNVYTHTLPPEVATWYGIPDVRGYDALHPWRIARLLRAAGDLPGAVSEVQALPLRNDPDLRLLGLMSVRALSDYRGDGSALETESFRLDGTPGAEPFVIATNPFFLPRARLVTGARVEPDDERALELLASAEFPRERSLVLPAGEPREPRAGEPGSADIVDDRPEVVRVAIRPAGPGFLLLSDTFFPGWVALVDGSPREILRANVAFRAVEVGPDDRLVEFRYEPFWYRAGAVLSLASGLLVLAVGAAPALRRRLRGSADVTTR